jgi:hypothetical protein
MPSRLPCRAFASPRALRTRASYELSASPFWLKEPATGRPPIPPATNPAANSAVRECFPMFVTSTWLASSGAVETSSHLCGKISPEHAGTATGGHGNRLEQVTVQVAADDRLGARWLVIQIGDATRAFDTGEPQIGGMAQRQGGGPGSALRNRQRARPGCRGGPSTMAYRRIIARRRSSALSICWRHRERRRCAAVSRFRRRGCSPSVHRCRRSPRSY